MKVMELGIGMGGNVGIVKPRQRVDNGRVLKMARFQKSTTGCWIRVLMREYGSEIMTNLQICRKLRVSSGRGISDVP